MYIYFAIFLFVMSNVVVCTAQTTADSSDESTDTTFVLDEIDTTEPPPKKWSLSLKSNIMTSQIRNGVDLSENNPTGDLGFKINHANGLHGGIKGVRRLGTNGFYQQTNIALGYDYEYSESLSFSADYTYYRYPNPDVNPLASTTSSLSLSASLDAKVVYVDFCFDRYLGTDPANFFSIDVSQFFLVGKEELLSIAPNFDISFTSFKFTNKNKVTKTIRGVSSISLDVMFGYDIGKGFSISADPMLLQTVQRDLVIKTKQLQLVFTAGIRYKFKW
ncbi:MAG: hypothetical protein U0Y96_11985 [Candidatus Kapaibacterium sp.]